MGGGAEDGGGVTVYGRKEIMMGEQCQSMDFSGVIYYDAEGHHWEWDGEEVKGGDGEVQSSYGLRHQHYGYTPRGPFSSIGGYSCPLHYTVYRPLKFYNSEIHTTSFCLSSFAKRTPIQYRWVYQFT
uniref:Uncharacterized protein n=1 Tax=Zea mays TaxID=4577 RepID=A0A804QTA8_MAIZE